MSFLSEQDISLYRELKLCTKYTLSENVEIMSQNPNSEDAELDLGELLSALWAHKFLITLITSLSVFLSGYYSITAEKNFTAKAIFEISQKSNTSRFKFPEGMGALVSVAGLGTNSSSSSVNSLLERVKGREFILNFKNKYQLIVILILILTILTIKTHCGRLL